MATRATWESDVVLADGGTVRVRPVNPGDEARVLRLYERLSDDSVYLRFFSPLPRPTAAQLEHLTTIDEQSHMTLAAVLGDDILAIARYDRVSDDEAEVAFTVADEQQGRGIGTVLLEHLAVVARANGIRSFSADTLSVNQRMLGVFAAAGWTVEHRLDSSGTVHVRFAIEPTTRSIAAVEDRERHAEAASMARLLAPDSIAVIGASRTPGTIGHELFRNLLAYGFHGPVYPVHPSASSVGGVRAYPAVTEIPDSVDVAIVVVPAAVVGDVIEQCATKGVKGLVVVSAGFAEVGDEGATRQRELVRIARGSGMRIIGPNCLGVVNTDPQIRMNATFAPVPPETGRVAFLSQSGGLGIELMARAARVRARHFGVRVRRQQGRREWQRLVAALGAGSPHRRDLDVSRVVRESAQVRPAGPPHRSSQADHRGEERAYGRGKPGRVVAHCRARILRCGGRRVVPPSRRRPRRHARRAPPHLAGAGQPAAPRGRRVAIIGNAGGPGILAADACMGAGLVVEELGAATQSALRAFAAPDASVRNPIDLVAGASAGDFERRAPHRARRRFRRRGDGNLRAAARDGGERCRRRDRHGSN